VIVRPLSVVTGLPRESSTVTVTVEVCVEPASSEDGVALQASFDGAPTFGTWTSW